MPIPRTHAFSLVEVVLSLGIVSFALVSAFGLLTVGLSTSRDSRDDFQTAQVTATLLQQYRSLPSSAWASIPSSASYDADMKPVTSLSNAFYLVETTTASVNLVKTTTADAKLSSGADTRSVSLIIRFPAKAPAERQTVRTFTALVTPRS